MKNKDLIYIGIIGYLAYLLLKNNAKTKLSDAKATNGNTGVTAGNASNGGLNLGTNMDLPNLTPTSPNGLSTEVALNSSNVTPIVRNDNVPSQIFGNVTLPTPYIGSSIITPSPVDVITVSETPQTPIVLPLVPETPIVISNPSTSISTGILDSSIKEEVGAEVGNIRSPHLSGTSLITEPTYPINTVSAQLITNQPSTQEAYFSKKQSADEIISECGNSFSIPNNDKEGSYTNFWNDGIDFYIQTTSPLIKTIATKITKTAYLEGCERYKKFLILNS
jgi:hypothetical protein